MADNLFDGRKLRMLTVLDVIHVRALQSTSGQSLKGEDVARVLNRIVHERGKPGTIKTDNGSEFISKVMDRWAYERGVELDFSRPSKPTDNAMVESFNVRLRHYYLLHSLRAKCTLNQRLIQCSQRVKELSNLVMR